VTYEFFFAESQHASSYKAACTSALEKHTSTKFDLALIQIEESFHDLSIPVNPYFITKESFLTHQIPVQEFEIETAQRADKGLAICLNNMALATYAKLNGIPWLLKSNPTIAHELVIGLGSAQISDSRLGDKERFVGITTVFSGDGNYHLSSASKAVPFENYTAAFKEALRATVQKVRTDMNWRAKDHIRLIFHAAFKRFSDFDTRIVQEVVDDLVAEYEVEYAFVELSENHPYVIFDDQSQGKKDFETKALKGVYAPERSKILQLSNHDSLLTLTGPSEVKRPQDGLPSPLLLSLHRSSTFLDMTYITRQVFAFSCHSWRTFLPASLPVTIQYSDLIARALGSLSQLDRWNPDVMIGKIGKTRWFL
jgi:argonaute-like protein implicated in RNA metabolism and viral defense